VKKITFSLAVSLLLLILSQTASALGGTKPEKLMPDHRQEPTGHYEVLVFNENQWHPAGVLEYTKFLQEKQIDLPQLGTCAPEDFKA
jgi:hypothetical protein